MTAPTVDTEPSDTPTGPPPGWRGLLIPVNTESGDGRIFELADGQDPDIRPLPLPLCAQAEIGEGHDGGVVVGLIERVWLDAGAIWGEGTFDLADPVASEWARKLGDGYAGWVSADMDRIRYQQVPYDADGVEIPAEAMAEIEAPADVKYRVSQFRLMGATMVSGPAFAEAKIEPVWDVAPSDPAIVAAAGAQRSKSEGDAEEVKVSPPEQDNADTEPAHTGGMIALIPTAEDAARLAVAGGEAADDLHTTLAYLGDDVTSWTPAQTAALMEAVKSVRPGPIDGKVWAHASFNPGDDTDREQCAVYLTAADGLTDLRARVVDALKNHPDVPVDDETDSFDGYTPHLTAGYGVDVGTLSETGPIRYDRMRIALAGQQHDIPLEPVSALLVAAAIEYPAADFGDPHLPMPTPITVTRDGKVFGHVACWGTCHIGFADVCVTPPHSGHDYRYFHQGLIDTDKGGLPVGKLTLGTGHAPVTRGTTAQAAAAHYDNTGSAVAVVRCGEDEHGIWFAGRLLPGTTDEDIAALKRSGVSGDWRQMNRSRPDLELIAALCVNVPGFPIPRTEAIAASGNRALVAAGVVANHEALTAAAEPAPPVEIVDPTNLTEAFARAGAESQDRFLRMAAAQQRMTATRRSVADRRMKTYATRKRVKAADARVAATRLQLVDARMAPARIEAASRRMFNDGHPG